MGLLAILALLVVPVPRPLVDAGLVFSFGCGLLLLSSTLRARHPLEFTTFPALVLIATLTRLGLNVATTRWILSTGDGGTVVRAFGTFATAGDPWVGAAVYIVITILLVVVVSKGAERVAEVAARFSLDGLPGRQMAVDADMRAGVVTFEEARIRRGDLLRETRLYGAMDGAMKFVRGDTIAGIAITVINLVIGVILGMLRDGLSAGEAVSHYGIMMIGDGLCSQIPSLLTAVSAGLMVTRVPEESGTPYSFVQQLRREVGTVQSRWLEVGGGLALLGMLPGLPVLPFFVLAGGCAAIAWVVPASDGDDASPESLFESDSLARAAEGSERFKLQAPSEHTPVVLEMGAAISRSILEDDDGAALAAELQLAGVLMFERRGVTTFRCGVRLASRHLAPNEVRVLLHYREIIRTCIPMNMRWLFLSSLPEDTRALALEEWKHPISGALVGGFQVVEGLPGESVISLPRRVAMLVLGCAWNEAGELLRMGDLQRALNHLDDQEPGLVDAVFPDRLSVAMLFQCQRELAAEHYHVGRLETCLQALACAPAPLAIEPLRAMQVLRRALGGEYVSERMRGGVLYVWVFPEDLLQVLDQELQEGPLDSERWAEALRSLPLDATRRALLACPEHGRLVVRELVQLANIRADVVAMEEIPRSVEMVILGRVYLRPAQRVIEAVPSDMGVSRLI